MWQVPKKRENDVQHIVAVTALIFPEHTPDTPDTPKGGCGRGRGQWQAKHHQNGGG